MTTRQAWRFFGLALVLALPACATKKAPAVRPGTDFLRPYVGQQRVLRFQGDVERVVVRKKDRPQLPGTCDAAVQVRSAVVDKAGARLVLETIGTVAADDKPRPRCRRVPPSITLTMTGFSGESDVVGRLDQVLPTPEGYLRAYGVTFDRPPGAEPALAAASVDQVGASDQERRLEGRLTARPRRLFRVDPIYRDPRGKVKYEGEVEIEGVVGIDGRLYDGRVIGGLGGSEDEQRVRELLPMWRFEPGRRGNDLVPVKVKERLVFRIYY